LFKVRLALLPRPQGWRSPVKKVKKVKKFKALNALLIIKIDSRKSKAHI
jgi:hypothetical protein